ncbi:MAG: hypothetical protein HY855_00080 [Burkholderiales bacterium]|nr:hypothetical protein [Burkholderiales bacterium]
MTHHLTRLAATLLTAATCTASLAGSLGSSASSAGSASVGSLSDSVKGSSNSSSGTTRVAEGEYRVVAVAELAARPGMLQLRLQALAQPGEASALWLTLPRAALAQRALHPGDGVSARQRPYGIAFAHAGTGEPFFLALADAWHHELDARPVAL